MSATNTATAETIRDTLKRIPAGDILQFAREFLNALGYTSERVFNLDGSPESFVAQFPSLIGKSKANVKATKTEQFFLQSAESAHILFQFTEQEIAESGQMNLLEANSFDHALAKSFLFIAVKLKPGEYARGKYAVMTREISKRFGMPVCVLFENGGRVTLAFADRRKSKRAGDTGRDILGKVSLIRDVNCAMPHRAHLAILSELSLDERIRWINANKKSGNFDGLLQAWQAVLNTEELNKRFYKELFAWFKWAVKGAKFPMPEINGKVVPPEDHVIRLITRILFVWFIKEKGLVAEELFIEEQVRPLLKKYDAGGDNYYRAILQNLFFATLNTEISKRKFSKVKETTHRNFNLLRYEDLLADSPALLRLLEQTPFINGGLFDCLDSEDAGGKGGYRLDCFTDNKGKNHRQLLSVPNRLFFDDARGLFPLLNKYKFTVEENTPIEQEVALDPELLGKVFENLLAAYNPETSGVVRKQTGSYYTPREIVDYMVGEALVASLSEKQNLSANKKAFLRERLRCLFDYAYADDEELFDRREKREIVREISQLKVLDPAVGSGAFPMGVLHKLTLALNRLDPKNKIWHELQKDRAKKRSEQAYDRDDKQDRDAELLEVSKTFEHYKENFGRKLYLIQNSIFGVDIQPVACQIAKLRFFISLAIEQDPNQDREKNYGIKPLPNLETRFVAANSLIGLRLRDSGAQYPEIQKLEEQLRQNRERHFNAGTRRKKLACSANDKKLRQKLSEVLEDHFRRDAVWNAARRIVDEKIERLQRELAKYKNKQNAEQQDTLLPDGARASEQDRHDWREKITKLTHAVGEWEKLLAAVAKQDKTATESNVWKQAEKTAQAEEKMIQGAARKIAAWNPYDQNASAEWFDAEWMFGVSGGFDVVIGNPPYVQLQKDGGLLGNLYQNCGYTVFARSGDIYQLFYELGVNLLKDTAGVLAFITSNSWMRAKYGEKLRAFFSEQHRPLQLIDVGTDTFDAIVDTNILLVGRGDAVQSFKAVDMDTVPEKDFPPAAEYWLTIKPCRAEAWSIMSPVSATIQEKVKAIGTPLKDWDVQIYRGVTTGCNDAFVIDQNKRDELIAADSKSADILKPVLRGRDIRRYQAKWAGLYLIYARKGIAINSYKAIYQHLRQHHAALSNKAGGNQWYELQASPSDEFAAHYQSKKLFWMDMSSIGRFCYSDEEMYCNDKGFVLSGENLKYLCAILNSALVTWVIKNTALTTGMGLTQWKKFAVEKVSMPLLEKPAQRPFIKLVDQILSAKSKNSDADTAKLEEQIDQLVYQLYQLTREEIAVIKQS